MQREKNERLFRVEEDVGVRRYDLAGAVNCDNVVLTPRSAEGKRLHLSEDAWKIFP